MRGYFLRMATILFWLGSIPKLSKYLVAYSYSMIFTKCELVPKLSSFHMWFFSTSCVLFRRMLKTRSSNLSLKCYLSLFLLDIHTQEKNNKYIFNQIKSCTVVSSSNYPTTLTPVIDFESWVGTSPTTIISSSTTPCCSSWTSNHTRDA